MSKTEWESLQGMDWKGASIETKPLLEFFTAAKPKRKSCLLLLRVWKQGQVTSNCRSNKLLCWSPDRFVLKLKSHREAMLWSLIPQARAKGKRTVYMHVWSWFHSLFTTRKVIWSMCRRSNELVTKCLVVDCCFAIKVKEQFFSFTFEKHSLKIKPRSIKCRWSLPLALWHNGVA